MPMPTLVMPMPCYAYSYAYANRGGLATCTYAVAVLHLGACGLRPLTTAHTHRPLSGAQTDCAVFDAPWHTGWGC